MTLAMMRFRIYCQVGLHSRGARTLLGCFELLVSRVVTLDSLLAVESVSGAEAHVWLAF